MSQTDLKTLLTWLDPRHRPVLVQLPEPTYERVLDRWNLLKLTNASQS
jgi:hypothetical protein